MLKFKTGISPVRKTANMSNRGKIFQSGLNKGLSYGISLVETLVYVAVLAAIAVFSINTILSIFSAYQFGLLSRRVALDAETALERLTRELRLASNIDAAASSFGSNPSRIVLNTSKSHTDDTPAVKEFYLLDGRLVLRTDIGTEEFLTSDKAEISSFVLNKIDTPRSQAVKVFLTVEVSGRRNSVLQNFYQTAVLRRSY